MSNKVTEAQIEAGMNVYRHSADKIRGVIREIYLAMKAHEQPIEGVVDALKQAALDLHEAAGRFACLGKLDAQGCSELTRAAARKADAAIAALTTKDTPND